MRVVREVTPRELAERLQRGDAMEVIDVREPYEWRIAHLEGARLIPLGRFGADWSSLPRDRDIVVYCHHGTRSQAAAEFLVARGYDAVWNLAGGIDRWSTDVDHGLPRY
jgi:rhodanese-related sulfurtransferase